MWLYVMLSCKKSEAPHFRTLTASIRKDGLVSLYSALNFQIMSLALCKELLQKFTELNPSILF